MRKRSGKRTVGYAIYGLGDIAQGSVLPAFENARSSSRLVALISGDPDKRKVLGKRYGVPAFAREELDASLALEDVDALYICSPNTEHAEPCIQAARAGVHVLCEKPMATSSEECTRMIAACNDADVKLMIAYPLHFETVNLRAVEHVLRGDVGETRFFTSTFSYQLAHHNIRSSRTLGGGAFFDLGIYCINASRYLFRAEPEEVFAYGLGENSDGRFRGMPATFAVLMRFPEERAATFICSFDAGRTSSLRMVGTQGSMDIEEVYGLSGSRVIRLNGAERKTTRSYRPTDQFGPELVAFSDCILRDRVPTASGAEGLADLRVIEAIHQSIKRGRPVQVRPTPRIRRPDPRQEIVRPALRTPRDIHAAPPH